MDHHTVSTDDVSLHYFVSRPAITSQNPLIVLLLHGAGGDHHQFDDMATVLVEAGHIVITCDLRGHGLSQPCDSLDFSSMMDDLQHVLVDFKSKLDNPGPMMDLIVGGLSMGGMLSQVCYREKHHIWLQFGYRIQGLIPIACGSIGMVWPRITWMDDYRHDTNSHDMQAVREAIICSGVNETTQKEAQRAMQSVSDRALTTCLRACAYALPPNNANATTPSMTSPLPLYQMLIVGEADTYTCNLMEAWHQLNQQQGIRTSFHKIPFAGHLATLDAGKLIGEIVVDALYQR
ncbi:Alpha/Beta hydrolase protein [Radiomyces spectabilis]|uniref:Alpha/Beta hydrolase protein n=1 Tax=Radiomyces spectabilis TaxID=64574 RepID=UPI0022200170|nr:Alpha/Beta hydrolase protein [Radiomyces spectabilis]KAI8376352.1 Alpha/Beta hydrolase protein [Radiomyces spectabilis]